MPNPTSQPCARPQPLGPAYPSAPTPERSRAPGLPLTSQPRRVKREVFEQAQCMPNPSFFPDTRLSLFVKYLSPTTHGSPARHALPCPVQQFKPNPCPTPLPAQTHQDPRPPASHAPLFVKYAQPLFGPPDPDVPKPPRRPPVPRSRVPPARFPCPTMLKPHSASAPRSRKGQAVCSLAFKLKPRCPPLHSLVFAFFSLFVKYFSPLVQAPTALSC